MGRTKTADPETVTIDGQEWTRVVDDHGLLMSASGSVMLREDTVRYLVRQREAEAQRDARRRAEAEREHARFLAGERVELLGQTWVRHPDDPGVLTNLDRTVLMRESRLREIERQRAAEVERAAAAQVEQRRSLHEQLAELQRRVGAELSN